MIDKLIARLKEERGKIAVAAMETPGDGSLATYNRAVGRYAGLKQALGIIDEILKDQDDKERDL